MVRLRHNLPKVTDSGFSKDELLAELQNLQPNLQMQRIKKALDLVSRVSHTNPKLLSRLLSRGGELARYLSGLGLDTDSVIVGLVYRYRKEELVTTREVKDALGAACAKLLEEVLGMAATEVINLQNARLQDSEQQTQVENVRRLFIALINDVRVGVIVLCERVVALQDAKTASQSRQQRVAREALSVFAPLANRLGMWQIKWALEDLAFRYLDGPAYRSIASRLDGRREERENHIAQVVEELHVALAKADITARIDGRAKHIYSIWRKMRNKNVEFAKVYDVRAIRIVVTDSATCYSVLGLVHSRWRHIASEFDDYIANPKENGYRSIHTAVIGPQAKTLEIQIRSERMHEEAEYGICAHWEYKEDKVQALPTEKMTWLRQVLDWQQDMDLPSGFNLDSDLRADLRAGQGDTPKFNNERIYVATPKGHILELRAGATPVDFAYRVHTEVGHRCRSARVDGELVPLNRVLESGQTVQIITQDEPAPKIEWLDVDHRYVRTSRALEKIRSWFRDHLDDELVAHGKSLITNAIRRLNLGIHVEGEIEGEFEDEFDQELKFVCEQMSLKDSSLLLQLVATGEVPIAAIVAALISRYEGTLGIESHKTLAETLVGIRLSGSRGLPLASALCCHPTYPDAVVGVLDETRSFGLIHLEDCAATVFDHGVLKLQWEIKHGSFVFCLHISALDRSGLLLDITQLLVQEKVDLLSTQAKPAGIDGRAQVILEVRLVSIVELSRLIDRLMNIEDIVDVYRVDNQK